MNTTKVNGVILNDKISKHLSNLQQHRAESLADLLNDSIGFLLEFNSYFSDNAQDFIDTLSTLHNARTEFLNLIPEEKGGNHE